MKALPTLFWLLLCAPTELHDVELSRGLGEITATSQKAAPISPSWCRGFSRRPLIATYNRSIYNPTGYPLWQTDCLYGEYNE